GDQVVHLPIQMETDFIVEVPLHIRAAKYGTHAQRDGIAPALDNSQQASHDYASSRLTMWVMAVERRLQLSRSRSSCWRPRRLGGEKFSATVFPLGPRGAV